jgi:monovalent cation/hydrogen antiporter
VPYPILLVLGGLALGFVPGLPQVELHPDVVFLLFLPPLLYVSALFTSWRDFRANLRPISPLAVGLVLMTTCMVAKVAHWTIALRSATSVCTGGEKKALSSRETRGCGPVVV